MRDGIAVACVVLGIGLAFGAGSDQGTSSAVPLRLLLSEVQAGSMASEQYCVLVFSDRHYHYERANRKMGVDRIRKTYEGELPEADWNALAAILDNKDFRELKQPEGAPPLIVQDAHTFAISVARDSNFQNMEFLDNKSRKPYESQLKPLLGWWKAFRGGHMTESSAPADPRCSLDSTHAVFSQ
jgi:hypothetical protein